MLKREVRIFIGVVALLFFALAVAGKSFAMSEPPGPLREIPIILKNNRFQPSAIEAPAGEKLVLVIQNQDASAEEFESHDLKREKIVPPGETIKVKVGPLKPGSYGFFGEFHQDTAQGTLNVK